MDSERQAAASIVRFGLFELDRESGELRRRGKPVRLQEQPFLLLSRLVATPGDLVTREELRVELWPECSHGAFDTGINTAINKVRQALGDSAAQPRYIETVPRRGYRFIAPIEAGRSAVPAGRSLALAAAAVLALAVAGMTWRWVPADASISAPPAPAPTPLTTYLGHEVDPSLSPDGKRVAFAWTGENGEKFDIYTQLVGSEGPPLRLTGGPGVRRAPVWSPDGERIAFIEIRGDNAPVVLVSVPSLGGPRRKIAEGRFVPFTGSWSPDGKRIAWGEAPQCGKAPRIVAVSVESGEKHPLTSGPPDSFVGDVTPFDCSDRVWTETTADTYHYLRMGDRNPAFSPDGRNLLFTRGRAFSGSIYRLALNETGEPQGEPARVVPESFDQRWPFHPAWSPDGRDVIFEAPIYGAMSGLWRTSADGGASPVRLPFGENAWRPTVNPGSARLAYVQEARDANIWRVGLAEHADAGAPATLLSSAHHDFDPQYSPDGRRVAFVSNRSGAFEIWMGDAGGGNVRRMTSFGKGLALGPRWSPDGRFVAFSAHDESERLDVYVMDAQTGAARRRTSGPWPSVSVCWSPDGRWLYYSSKRPAGDEIWRIPADPTNGDAASQAAPTGGYRPQLSPDGRWIYYHRAGASPWKAALWRVPTAGGNEELLLEEVAWRNFEAVDDGVYYVPAREGRQDRHALFFLHLATGRKEKVTDLGEEELFLGISISPDRRSVLFTTRASSGSNLMLMEDFR